MHGVLPAMVSVLNPTAAETGRAALCARAAAELDESSVPLSLRLPQAPEAGTLARRPAPPLPPLSGEEDIGDGYDEGVGCWRVLRDGRTLARPPSASHGP
jgi:hypothetical protein